MTVAVQRAAPGLCIRPALPTDSAFIFATWVNHTRKSTEYGKVLGGNQLRGFHRTVASTLGRPTCRVLVATSTLPGEAEVIAGYLVTDAIGAMPVVHFGFVKGPLRRNGVMRALWEASGLDGNECLWTQPTEAEGWVRARFPKIEVLDFFR